MPFDIPPDNGRGVERRSPEVGSERLPFDREEFVIVEARWTA